MRIYLDSGQPLSVGQLPTKTNDMLAIEKTKEVADYMRAVYTAEIQSNGATGVPFPKWRLELLEECRYAAKLIAQAVKNESEFRPLTGRSVGDICLQEGLSGRLMTTLKACRQSAMAGMKRRKGNY